MNTNNPMPLPKPTLKIPWKDFVDYAIIYFQDKTDIQNLLTNTIQFQKQHSDGDYQVCEIPDYVEIEFTPTKTRDTDHCSLCDCNINDISFGNINGKLLCQACFAKNK